jgi:hypothetical protein
VVAEGCLPWLALLLRCGPTTAGGGDGVGVGVGFSAA